jgi:ArsR family metal-binding transcriptional regulator
LSSIFAENFQGITKVGEKECMVFRDKILPPRTQIGKPVAPLKDLPEVENQLPTALQVGKVVATYKYESCRPTILSLYMPT